MNGPSIALCVPAYNASSYLPRLLKSASRQATPFAEIIVCDDSSRDDTASVARSYGAKVVVNSTNQGCSACKNRALETATAEWIHFHDADDELFPNFTTLARRWAVSADAPDVILFDYEYRDNDSNELIGRSDFDDVELREDPLRYAILHQINPFCGLYRRRRLMALDGYDTDPEVLYNEDVAFHCKLALAGLIFRAEKEVSIINYRLRGSMSASNQVRCLKAHHAVMHKVATVAGTRYPKEIASRFWAVATGLAAVNDWDGVERALREARELDMSVPADQTMDFRIACKLVGPHLAFRAREKVVRWLKPGLRGSPARKEDTLTPAGK